MPQYFLLNFLATTAVVPVPKKGSKIELPILVVANIIGGEGSIITGSVVTANVVSAKTASLNFFNIGAAIVDDASINYNLDAEITGFEGFMSFFPSETTQIQFSWLAIDNEITSDTSIINYLNPVGGQLAAYLGAVDPNGTGAITGAAFSNGATLFKSGGFNCLAPQFAPAAGLPCPVAQGVPTSLKGNQLPNTAELEYSLSFTKIFTTNNGETSAKLSYRYRDESNSSAFAEERMAIPSNKYFDMLVRFTPNDSDWYVALYGKNIADDRQLQFLRTASNLQGGQLYGSFSDPRTWGLQFGFEF